VGVGVRKEKDMGEKEYPSVVRLVWVVVVSSRQTPSVPNMTKANHANNTEHARAHRPQFTSRNNHRLELQLTIQLIPALSPLFAFLIPLSLFLPLSLSYTINSSLPGNVL
jgi:hypothetical protein